MAGKMALIRVSSLLSQTQCLSSINQNVFLFGKLITCENPLFGGVQFEDSSGVITCVFEVGFDLRWIGKQLVLSSWNFVTMEECELNNEVGESLKNFSYLEILQEPTFLEQLVPTKPIVELFQLFQPISFCSPTSFTLPSTHYFNAFGKISAKSEVYIPSNNSPYFFIEFECTKPYTNDHIPDHKNNQNQFGHFLLIQGKKTMMWYYYFQVHQEYLLTDLKNIVIMPNNEGGIKIRAISTSSKVFPFNSSSLGILHESQSINKIRGRLILPMVSYQGVITDIISEVFGILKFDNQVIFTFYFYFYFYFYFLFLFLFLFYLFFFLNFLF